VTHAERIQCADVANAHAVELASTWIARIWPPARPLQTGPAKMCPSETTARICREELRDLLDIERNQQRVTARMPALTLTGLLLLHDDPPEPEIIIQFHAPWLLTLEQWPRALVIAATCSAAMFVISLLWRLL
jgi:hypothetical protein